MNVKILFNSLKSPAIRNVHQVAESPNWTKILHSSSILKNSSFELGSNSGDKEDGAHDLMPNFSSSIKFRHKRKNLLTEFDAIGDGNNDKSYSYFNMPSIDILAKVKQSQDSKKIIKKLNFEVNGSYPNHEIDISSHYKWGHPTIRIGKFLNKIININFTWFLFDKSKTY